MPVVPSRRVYIGIDPGASGAIAVINGSNVELTTLSTTEKSIWEALDKYGLKDFELQPDPNSIRPADFAVIEWIHPAIYGVGKSSMSKLYGSYMSLRMALTAAGIPFEIVKPLEWQRGLSIPQRKKTENQNKWKNRLKAKAEQLFPPVKVTLATADALLIALYCKRKHEGTL